MTIDACDVILALDDVTAGVACFGVPLRDGHGIEEVAPGVLADGSQLDMFAGSGSTLVAAILSGRKAVGVEVAAEHYETALARCVAAETLWRAGQDA